MKKIEFEEECPSCRMTCHAVTNVSDDAVPPKPEDMLVCGYCHTLLTFNDDLSLRLATADEIAECEFQDIQLAHKLIGEST